MNRLAFLITSLVFAAESHANCPAEKLAVDQERVYSVSCFEGADYFSAITLAGELAWEVPFGAKILNWKMQEGLVFIFSKDRKGNPNYLTCIDSANGMLKWEKVIWAPIPQN